MKKFLIVLVLALAGFTPANAQFSFTINVEYYGACRNEAQKIADSYLNQYTQLASGIPTSSDCERLRNVVNGINYSLGSGKTLCGARLKAGPCTGRALTNDVGHNVGYNDIRISNINGVSQGSSFYSNNPANEIKNWSDDDIARLIAFNKLYQAVYDEFGIITGDPDFDNARKNKDDDYEFTGRMPEGSVGLVPKNDQIVSVGPPTKGSGVSGLDDLLTKPHTIKTEEWGSSDLNTVDILLERKEFDIPLGYQEKKEGIIQSTFHKIDEKMDWYQADNPNVFQWMYTRLGKDNIMAGVDWWERNDIGNRLTNAVSNTWNATIDAVFHPIDTYNNVREGAISTIKENASSAIQFLVPPQQKDVIERAQGIKDTEKGIISDALTFVKNAPDMISRGETPDFTTHLKKYSDDVQNLGISFVEPKLAKPIRKLQVVEDIYNLPQNEQGKELKKMIKKEGESMVKSGVKNSKYYKKMEEESKTIVDPYHFFFE